MKRTRLERKTPLRAKTPMRKRRSGTRRTSYEHVPKAVRQAHMDGVARIGCVACLIDGNAGTPPELHHPRSDAGAGQKSSDMDVLPLCCHHHRGTDHPRTPSIHLDRLVFIEKYGTESALLAYVRELLVTGETA